MSSLLRRAIRTGRSWRAELANPAYVPAGHYYSPRTSAADVLAAKMMRRPPLGIDLCLTEQAQLARELRLEVPSTNRWTSQGNSMFGPADASVLLAMLRRHRPSRVVEVGSGFSTAVMLDAAEDFLPELRITCVEPYPDRLRTRLRPGDEERLELIEAPVQSVAPESLVRGLGPGDMLFVDSTHVVKAGSDVCHLLLHTLPLVPVGVLVHVHDIFWPFEYTDSWLNEHRDWTEAYLLHALLSGNPGWRIELFASWLWAAHPDLAAPGTTAEQPGSIWLRRVETPPT